MRADPRYVSSMQVDVLLGDSSRAKEILRWVSEFSGDDKCPEMVDVDLARPKQSISQRA